MSDGAGSAASTTRVSEDNPKVEWEEILDAMGNVLGFPLFCCCASSKQTTQQTLRLWKCHHTATHHIHAHIHHMQNDSRGEELLAAA